MAETKRAFTLIELLVVIAVIALLMGVLMPALRAAREQGRMIRCGANVRSLTMAWLVYQDDNDGQLVPGSANGQYNPEESNWWVQGPRSIDLRGDSEEAKEGIRRGLLYPYVKDVSAYHCPSDIRTGLTVRIGESPERIGDFRSYSIPMAAYGIDDISGDDIWADGMIFSKKYTDLKSPASKYVFVPGLYESVVGSWHLNAYAGHWHSLLAIWHSRNRSTLGWADGHVESHRWQDTGIELASLGMEWIQGNGVLYTGSVGIKLIPFDGSDTVFVPHTGEDVQFMSRGYPVKKLLSKPGP
jgi:prepilin-type N-terminal cleavage/methylation domain-containing protein/prepilin-type processing-associated H-X9-DG protein